MNICRITRLLYLIQELYSGSGQNPAGLAKACEVSRRTVFRDIEALRAAGLPVAFDAEHDLYTLSDGNYRPPGDLTPAESLSLFVLAFEFGQSDRLPYFDAARSAASKLERSFPRTLRNRFRKIRRGIEIRPGPTSADGLNPNFYQQLVDARLAGQVLRIRYDLGASEGQLTTKLRPYHLMYCRHSWYTIGRSSFHRRIRTFNLNRISEIETLDEQFCLPSSFRVDKYLRNAWQLMPEEGPDYDIAIRFSSEVARSVAEVKWHKTQRLEVQTDGALIYRAQVSGLNEIVSWILSYGDQAEVIMPFKLRQLVRQRARKMLEIYDGSS